MPIFIERAVKNLPITIYGDGEQTRDFIYVKDIVAANVFFATQSSATGVFNVAYGQTITIANLAQDIVALRLAVENSARAGTGRGREIFVGGDRQIARGRLHPRQ